MNLKKNFCASICVNIFVLGIFLLLLQQLDGFMQLIFSFIPTMLSIIVCAVINRKKEMDSNNYIQCAGICAGLNLVSLIIEYVCISSVADTNKIYEISQKYQSEYVTVSENNSPIFSIIIFTVVSFILHYFIIKKVSTEKL